MSKVNEEFEFKSSNIYSEEKKEKLIRRWRNRLRRIVKPLSKHEKHIVHPLIDNIAFSVVQLEELRELIIRDGYYDYYKNGENQYGRRKSVATDVFIQTSKNYSMFLQRLQSFLPDEINSSDDMEDFRKRQAKKKRLSKKQ